MKKFIITYYDIDGYLDDEVVECKKYDCAEKQAIKRIEKRIAKAQENFEIILCFDYNIQELKRGVKL